MQVTSAKSITTVKSGDDYIITMTSGTTKGTVTLQDAATNYTLTKSGKNFIVRPKATTAKELPADDGYWFLDESATDEVKESPLSEIVSSESAVDMPTDFFGDALKQSTNELVQTARHRQKKSIG